MLYHYEKTSKRRLLALDIATGATISQYGLMAMTHVVAFAQASTKLLTAGGQVLDITDPHAPRQIGAAIEYFSGGDFQS